VFEAFAGQQGRSWRQGDEVLLQRGHQDAAEHNVLHDRISTELVSFRPGAVDPALANLEFQFPRKRQRSQVQIGPPGSFAAMTMQVVMADTR
jgi:hypothetical protein